MLFVVCTTKYKSLVGSVCTHDIRSYESHSSIQNMLFFACTAKYRQDTVSRYLYLTSVVRSIFSRARSNSNTSNKRDPIYINS